MGHKPYISSSHSGSRVDKFWTTFSSHSGSRVEKFWTKFSSHSGSRVERVWTKFSSHSGSRTEIFWTKRFNLLYLTVEGYLPSENTLTSRGGRAGKDRRVAPILAALAPQRGGGLGDPPENRRKAPVFFIIGSLRFQSPEKSVRPNFTIKN